MIKLHIDKEIHFMKGSILDPDFGYWVGYDRIVFYNVYMNNKKIGLVQNYYKGENLLSVSRPYFWEPSQDAFKAGREHSLHTAIKKLVYLVSWRDKHLVKEESTDDNTQNNNYTITRVEKNYPVPRYFYSLKWDKQIKYEIYFGSRNFGYVSTYFLNNEMVGSPHSYVYTYIDQNSEVIDYGSFSSLKLALQYLIKQFESENYNEPDEVEESTDNRQNNNYRVNRLEVEHDEVFTQYRDGRPIHFDKQVFYEIYIGSKKLGYVTTLFLNNAMLDLPEGSYLYKYFGPIDVKHDPFALKTAQSLNLAIKKIIGKYHKSLYIIKNKPVKENASDKFLGTTASVSTFVTSTYNRGTPKRIIKKTITIKRNGITLGEVNCHYNMDNTIYTGIFKYPNVFKWDAWLIDKQLYPTGYVDSLSKAIKKILDFHKNPHDELNEASETSGNYHVERVPSSWGGITYRIYKTTKSHGNRLLGVATYDDDTNSWNSNVINSKNLYYGLGICKNLNTCIAKVIDWHKEFDSVTLSSPNITIKHLETKKVLRGNEQVDQTTEGVYYKNTLIGKIIKTDIADEPYLWEVILENRILYGREREGSADTKEKALYRILSWHHSQVTFQDMQATT